MLMKRFGKTILLLGTIGLTMAMTGCSKGGSDDKKNNEIEMFSTKAENISVFKEMIKEFEEENPEIKVKFVAPADAGTVLKTRLTKNDIPDVIAMGADFNFVDVAGANILEDLSEKEYSTDAIDEYKDMVTKLYEADGLLGVPYAANASGMMYNKALFEKAGIKNTPETWSEFISTMDILKKKNIQPIILPFKDAWTTMGIWNQLAGNLVSEDFVEQKKAGKVTFADTHQEAAQKFLDIVRYGQKDFLGTSYDDSNKAFANGEAAIVLNGNFVIPEFVKNNKNVEVELVKFPVFNEANKNKVTSGVDVLLAKNKDSKKSADCDKLISFLVEKQNAKKYIDDQFAFSALEAVEQNSLQLAGLKTDVADGNVVDYPDHTYPAGYDMAGLLQQFALNCINGKDDKTNIEEFLKQADEAFDSIYMKE